MAELTPDERRRIYEEEKAKEEAGTRADSVAWEDNPKYLRLIVLCTIGFVAIGLGIYWFAPTDDPFGPPQQSQAVGEMAKPNSPALESEHWSLLESTNKIDNTPSISLHNSAVDANASLIIRCSGRTTDAYVITTEVIDRSASVRLKLDDSAAVRDNWSRSQDYHALFTPDAIAFSRQLAKGHSFLFEFKPFDSGPRTVEFNVSGLDPKLERIAKACEWNEVDKQRARVKAADDQRRRIAEQQERLGVFHLSDDPVVIRGFRIPQPYGWTAKVTTGDPDHIDIFSLGRVEDLT
jgi:hypothetical protein